MLEAAVPPPPDSAMVCIITVASAIPRFAPPYRSGMHIPSHPSLAMAVKKSVGHCLVLSTFNQYSSGKLTQIFAIASRTVRWESVRSGSPV